MEDCMLSPSLLSRVCSFLYWFFKSHPLPFSAWLCVLGGWPLGLHHWYSLAVWLSIGCGQSQAPMGGQLAGRHGGDAFPLLVPICYSGCIPYQHSSSDFSSPDSSNTASILWISADNDCHPLPLPGCLSNLYWSLKLAKFVNNIFF